jgi:hypothetical protein
MVSPVASTGREGISSSGAWTQCRLLRFHRSIREPLIRPRVARSVPGRDTHDRGGERRCWRLWWHERPAGRS